EPAPKHRPDGDRNANDRTEGSKGAGSQRSVEELLNEPNGLRVEESGTESGDKSGDDQHGPIQRESGNERPETKEHQAGHKQFAAAKRVAGASTGHQSH